MNFSLSKSKILHSDTIYEDDFLTPTWEITNSPTEQSFVKDSYYWMENKTTTRWMFYHQKMPKVENFYLTTEIELLEHPGYGQFGLVWGFNKKHETLNRFSLSADSPRFSICQFDKDHNRVYHRFTDKYKKPKTNKIKLSIVLIGDYYSFYLLGNPQPVYICHKAHMNLNGSRFGFYVEPGIMIRADKITMKRLIIDKG